MQPSDIDWVFCWRTTTGEIRPGSRDTKMNGSPVPYEPRGDRPDAGVRTIVRGREQAWSDLPSGPSLQHQGALSRMAAFVRGHVTAPHIIPARTPRDLAALQSAAREAMSAGDASEWALAVVGARGAVVPALHIGAAREIIAELAWLVDVPWTLDVREKRMRTWFDGVEIAWVDGGGRVLTRIGADSFFDVHPRG